MIKFIRNINQYFKKIKFANNQKKNLNKKGTLLHSFSEKKQIFIHIPKTAGISVVKSFFGDITLEGHRSVWFYKQVLGKDLSEFFIFTFVRNPWDRLYSAYKFLQKGGINIHDKNAFDMYLSEYNDFEDFVLNGLNEEILFEITHFIPQHEEDVGAFIEFLGVDFSGNIYSEEVARKRLIKFVPFRPPEALQ